MFQKGRYFRGPKCNLLEKKVNEVLTRAEKQNPENYFYSFGLLKPQSHVPGVNQGC